MVVSVGSFVMRVTARNPKAMRIGGLLATLLLLAACSGEVPVPPLASATIPAAASATPTATSEAAPTQALSYPAETYRDEIEAFEFEYPASWTVGPVEQYDRGRIIVFTSWTRPTDVLPDANPIGGTRLDAAVMLWDPVQDLEAYVEHRMRPLRDTGFEVISREEWTLEGGIPAAVVVVESSAGDQAFLFITTIGDKYLVLSGDGDLALLAEIAGTVRIAASNG